MSIIKKLLKLYCLVIVILSFLPNNNTFVFAQTDNSASLTMGVEKIVSEDIYDDNGNFLGTLSIEDVTDEVGTSLRAVYPLENKVYKVNFFGGSMGVGYYVNVQNKKIASAYGQYAWGIIWNSSDLSLYYDSVFSELTGTTGFGFKIFGFHTTFRLQGYIEGNTFRTYVGAP